MLYPIVDRRDPSRERRNTPDRRSGTARKKHERRSRDRRVLSDRRQLVLDRELLLKNLRLPGYPKEEPRWLRYMQALGVPVAIAVGSLAVTAGIAIMQKESEEWIIDEQLRFQKTIQDSEQRNALERADAELKTRRLAKIVDIFAQIITVESKKEASDPIDVEELRQKVSSLVAYRDEALPFLLQLRTYKLKDAGFDPAIGDSGCAMQGQKHDVACAVREAARESIKQVLGESQLDIGGQVFEGHGEILNLRHRKYAGYNLSDSRFIAVNLYKSDFSEATLKNVSFESADLVRASFKGSNLTGATFIDSDLKGTNFENAKLQGVILFNCRRVEEAIFSLGALLRLDDALFNELTPKVYVSLLSRYREELSRINEDKPQRLDEAIRHAGVDSFPELLQLLDRTELGNRTIDSDKGNPTRLGFADTS